MTNTLAQWFADNWGSVLSAEVLIFIVSMIPILELRGGLLVASLLHVNIWRAVPICIIGNLVPIPLILFLFTWVMRWMKKVPGLCKLAFWAERHAMNKSDTLAKGEFLGLLLFVGVPLPGTGAWTGCALAALLGMDKKKSFPAAMLGVLLAAFIMTVVSYGILGRVW